MCVEEAIIHCYLDHELSSDIFDPISSRISSCSDCDASLLKAMEEATLVDFALAYEMALLVPSERLGLLIEAIISAE
jgi:hypothetical protein